MKTKKTCYILVLVLLVSLLLMDYAVDAFGFDIGPLVSIVSYVSSPLVLAVGILFALVFGNVYSKFNSLMAKKMLQYSVVGLGFGMNLEKALSSGWEGMLFTIVSVFVTLAIGWIIGRKILGVEPETSYLISSGTAICGGSAIAAVGSVLNAKAENLSVALAVVFVLNAVALFVFPIVGSALGMSMKQFGMWAAIAIHDTSSVVGAGAAYDQMHPDLIVAQGVSALEMATTIKLTRALWITILVLLTPALFKDNKVENANRKSWYKNLPTFIIWFLIAILLNTYVLNNSALLGEECVRVGSKISFLIGELAKHLITLSMFFIGASLTIKTLRNVGLRPFIQGFMLWICIGFLSLFFVMGLQ